MVRVVFFPCLLRTIQQNLMIPLPMNYKYIYMTNIYLSFIFLQLQFIQLFYRLSIVTHVQDTPHSDTIEHAAYWLVRYDSITRNLSYLLGHHMKCLGYAFFTNLFKYCVLRTHLCEHSSYLKRKWTTTELNQMKIFRFYTRNSNRSQRCIQ